MLPADDDAGHHSRRSVKLAWVPHIVLFTILDKVAQLIGFQRPGTRDQALRYLDVGGSVISLHVRFRFGSLAALTARKGETRV